MESTHKTILRIILSYLIIFSGNFGYGLLHSECMMFSDKHIQCVSECCTESSCCKLQDKGTENITSGDDCCEVHESKKMVPEEAVKLLNNPDKTSKFCLFRITNNCFYSFSSTISELVSNSNIPLYLSVSCLRI